MTAVAGLGIGLEAAAQVADLGLDRGGAVDGRAVSPDAVDESLGRDNLVAQDQERREDGALTSPTEVDDRALSRGRQLAEHPRRSLGSPSTSLPRSAPSRITTRQASAWDLPRAA